ncbi:MAG: F0F1 ATP synthase subunit A [Gammaproteobacteria bacterium]
MNFNSDQIILWQIEPIPDVNLSLNATLVFTWLVMGLLVALSAVVTRNLSSDAEIPAWQNVLEVVVLGISDQIRAVSQQEPSRYLPFIGTLFLFIALSNLLAVFPVYRPPTGSLSTTTALAICVFVAVPIYGISQSGLSAYFRQYLKPTIFMLPFNIVGEFSRTLALAVRLYGNIMSGTVITATLLSFAPFFFPILMQILGLLTGMIQAYIFAILAMVYIASATVAHENKHPDFSQAKSDKPPEEPL